MTRREEQWACAVTDGEGDGDGDGDGDEEQIVFPWAVIPSIEGLGGVSVIGRELMTG